MNPKLLALWLLVLALADQQGRWGKWRPSTEGWLGVLRKREEQIQHMPELADRLDAFNVLAHQGWLIQNFTSTGFSVVPQPKDVHQQLLTALQSPALSVWQDEGTEGRIVSGRMPQFTSIGELGERLLQDLQHVHEAWADVELEMSAAYGLRVYQEGNTLAMHADHFSTHIISSILHIGQDLDEPWPIAIEGFDGETAEVDLRPGQMLLYESAKCLHGRLRPLKGRWYTSLFMHYRPKGWVTPSLKSLVGKPSLEHVVEDGRVPKLRRVRQDWNGLHEPECSNGWCVLQNQTKNPRPQDEL